MKLMRFLTIVMVLLSFSNNKSSESQPWFEDVVADIGFVNKTGYDLDIITVLKNGTQLPKNIVTLEKDDVKKALILKNQNLNQIKEYQINFSGGSYIAKPIKEPLKIDADVLANQIIQKEQFSATITINAKKALGYPYGFQKPSILVKPSSAKKKGQFQLEESFIILQPELEKEALILLSLLGLSDKAQPYEIFNLEPYPQANPQKSFNEQSKEVFDYMKKLEKEKEQLIKAFVSNSDFDVAIYEQYGVDNFSERARKLIEAAYQAILRGMGAK